MTERGICMKEKMSIPYTEQEMIINYSPDEMGKNCEIYTTIPWMMKFLEGMVEKYPDHYKLIKDDQYSYTVKVPYKLVKPRAPKILSDEQRKAMGERLAEARARK